MELKSSYLIRKRCGRCSAVNFSDKRKNVPLTKFYVSQCGTDIVC